MNLRQVDLNLLHVFDAVMKHRSVTRASDELSLSPSAVSHALGRLRQALKDDLFLRDETGLQPTPRAMELAAHVRGGLALLERALATGPFAPEESIRSFRLAAGDYVCSLILPRLVRRLAQAAPNVDLQIFPVNRVDVARQLDTGVVEVVIGWFGLLAEGLQRRPLLREDSVFVVRQDHPLTQGIVTWERLFDFPHVVVELTGPGAERGDGFQSDRGLSRRVWMERAVLEARKRPDLTARVALSVPHFTAVPPLLCVSDMVATLPTRFARKAAEDGSVVLLDPSLDTGSVEVEAVWHSRAAGDPGLAWLLNELAGACAEPD